MLAIKLGFVIVFIFAIVLVSYAQRRIDGETAKSDKTYLVYLIKAQASPLKYDEWLCGGALVSDVYIITSAACVEDVQHLYAIAGYRKYVPMESIQLDPCTREKKKKVVFICVPKNFDLVYERLEKWSNIDIAVVKVESPYDFSDRSYQSLCSYIPTLIPVNYEYKYQEPGVDTLTFGWGHANLWRNPNDGTHYNLEDLHYASSVILDKPTCKSYYDKFQGMGYIIDKYMICTLEPGNFNDAGELIIKRTPVSYVQGCITRMQRLRGLRGTPCVEPNQEGVYNNEDVVLNDETRRDDWNGNYSVNDRRHGICQNDHGGPLVTWVGSREILIGVASVFRVNADSKCEGPYLFTSTQCNGAFLDCILNSRSSRRASCDAPPAVRGFDKHERHISWKGHPDGPAENEIEHEKPRKQPLRERPLPERQYAAQQLPQRQLPEQQYAEQQLPERQLQVHQSEEPQRAEQQNAEQQLPEQQYAEQQLPEQQYTEQQLLERQLREQQYPQTQLRERQLTEQNLPALQLPEHHSTEHQSSDNDVQLSELLSPELLPPELRSPGQQSAQEQIPQQQFYRPVADNYKNPPAQQNESPTLSL